MKFLFYFRSLLLFVFLQISKSSEAYYCSLEDTSKYFKQSNFHGNYEIHHNLSLFGVGNSSYTENNIKIELSTINYKTLIIPLNGAEIIGIDGVRVSGIKLAKLYNNIEKNISIDVSNGGCIVLALQKHPTTPLNEHQFYYSHFINDLNSHSSVAVFLETKDKPI
jgi:hypothetical protein